MTFIGPVVALIFVVLVVWLLLRNYYPHAVLLVAGLLMLIISYLLGYNLPPLNSSTGAFGLDLFKYIKESFASTNAGVGLMIMAIGGFVAYIDHIGASKALVEVAIKPLNLLKKSPNAAAAAVIPISQILFIAIPSAAGLSLLLMASIFSLLVKLGVSRLSAVSVITASTAIGLGPASAITASASGIVSKAPINYFVEDQLPLFIPLSIVLAITYFFVVRYYHKKEMEDGTLQKESKKEDSKVIAPKIYAIIPVLPILLLIVFSDLNSFLPYSIKLDTTTAMFTSLFIALMLELLRGKGIKNIFDSFKVFWSGMGNIFKTVVTLIIAADIFSQGLISLNFIGGLLEVSQSFGFNAIGISIVMTILIFFASMLMGSGNAAFFSFGPLVPEIAAKFAVKSTSIILPMNFAASMGRTVSPVAGVLIATAEIAGVTSLQIVKRNLIPLFTTLGVMLIYHFI